jgi:hypothetical protein
MNNKERFGPKEIYRFFKNKFTKNEIESLSFIDYDRFIAITKEFNKELMRMIIEEGVEFKMPYRLGYLRIKKFKRKYMVLKDGTIDKRNQSINWKATRDLWKDVYPGKTITELKEVHGKPIVYYLNEHTNGYGFMFYWNKKGSNAVNRSIYSSILTFSNNRHLAKVLKGDNKVDYYE